MSGSFEGRPDAEPFTTLPDAEPFAAPDAEPFTTLPDAEPFTTLPDAEPFAAPDAERLAPAYAERPRTAHGVGNTTQPRPVGAPPT